MCRPLKLQVPLSRLPRGTSPLLRHITSQTNPTRSVPHASPPGISPVALASSSTGNTPAPSPGLGEGPGGLSSPAIGQQGGVGVGISPGATSEAVEVPGNKGHARRGSERCGRFLLQRVIQLNSPSNHGVRVSPPGTMREERNPSSSYPIGHGGFGSSPVKTSNLARRLDEEMEG